MSPSVRKGKLNLELGTTTIEDTFAEAFSMRYSRIIVTATSQRWLDAAVVAFCGYGSSVIGCDAEVAVERPVPASETLDGRPGVSLMVFGFSADAVQKALANRTGQSLMTCPTTAVFDGSFESQRRSQVDEVKEFATAAGSQSIAGSQPVVEDRIALGKHLRFFGDGFQKSKLIGQRRFWRIPVMDGEFIVEDTVGVFKGVAGGNFLILTTDQPTGLQAAERAVDAIAELPNVITPFPGGIVRSGSKVGSRYKDLRASTAHQYCPTLRGRVETKLPAGVSCVYEIVIDGADFESVAIATREGIRASIGPGVASIGAGNYGGKLGKHHFHLHQLLEPPATDPAEQP